LDLRPVPGLLPEPVPEEVVPVKDLWFDEVEDGLDLFLSASVSSSGFGDLAVLPDATSGFLLGDLSAKTDFGAYLS
jgi:hypothetical protein